MKLATLIPASNFGSHNKVCIVKEVNYGKWFRKIYIYIYYEHHAQMCKKAHGGGAYS